MSDVKAAVLDIDGTLLLSNDAHAQAYVDAAAELDIPAHFDTVRRLIGKGGDKLIPEAFGFPLESDKGERLDKRKGEIFKAKYLPKLKPTAGARDLVKHLREQGLKLAVATSAGKDDVIRLLEQAGVREFIKD